MVKPLKLDAMVSTMGAPAVLTRHLVFEPGGSEGWKIFLCRAHQYVDIAKIAISAFVSLYSTKIVAVR